MNDNLELDETKVASSMPTSYVEFVRRLWRKQEKESRYTWGRELELARRPVFLRLLASDKLGAELRRAYETAVGAKIAEALTRQAVHIPELWVGEDQRTKNEKVAQFKKLKAAMEHVSALLSQDRTIWREEDIIDPECRRADGISSSKHHARNQRAALAAFDEVFSEPIAVRRYNGLMGDQLPDREKLRLSLYGLHYILQAFHKPLAQEIEHINRFRTRSVDDPILKEMGQVTKGTPYIRYAALLLDQSIDRFTDDFTTLKRKLSRDKLVSAFVKALYQPMGPIADYQAINRICGPRRKSITNSAA